MLGVQSAGPLSRGCQSQSSLRVSEAGSGAGSPKSGAGAGSAAGPARGRADCDASDERDAWVVLLAVPGLGPVTFAALLAAFGSARATLAAAAGPNGVAELREAMAARTDGGGSAEVPADFEARTGPPLGADLASRIRHPIADADRALAVVRSLGLTVVTLDDQEYPERLRRIDMPPPLLFVRGSLAALTSPAAVAVVGTRRPTDKGRLIAAWIGSALARAGAVVVSGLAVGIDGAAHAAVVSEGLPTVAVLGGGHACLFPKAHERLADAIAASGGAVVAELPPETPATRGTFPRRNRLVSGLSDATVVVEAGRHSGALITAGWALEQGRECFLVPGPLDAPASEGCHAFLRSFPGQTRVVCGIPELIEDLGLRSGDEEAGGAAGDVKTGPGAAPAGEGALAGRMAAGEREVRPGRPGPNAPGAGIESLLASLAPVERSVAELLSAGPATADDLASGAGLSGAAILSALTLLELRGLVVGSYGRYMPSGALARWPGGIPTRRR